MLSTKSFERDFRKLSLESKRRTDRKIRQLQENPHLGKPLHGDLKGRYSLTIGNYNVIYAVDEETKTITLIAVGHRKKIYKP
ncbi:type II toxin-antitoxin system RelE/ParE family toxin [Candidatus Hecatella orcuttiae]|uniref:type II toxin-antitoxin system RelE family toxin n=1 Tax=Candidatus Hecatella orcuttiae TaxID=1935119 RepID=UPI002867C5D5|nr:type II toxin-antitoxin system RelE/ParE family toxin [Candidatus Hecatella orcuttiae]